MQGIQPQNYNSYYASCTVHLRARKASNTHAKSLHIICINAFKSALLKLAFAFFLFDLYSLWLPGEWSDGLIYSHPIKYNPHPSPLFKNVSEDVYKKGISEGCKTEDQIFWGYYSSREEKILNTIRLVGQIFWRDIRWSMNFSKGLGGGKSIFLRARTIILFQSPSSRGWGGRCILVYSYLATKPSYDQWNGHQEVDSLPTNSPPRGLIK